MREQFARGERDAASGRNAAHGERGKAAGPISNAEMMMR